MQWVTVIWSMSAAACFTLAVIHFVIWLKQRHLWSHLIFSCSATGAAVLAGFELKLMNAQTSGEYGALLRWAHVPLFIVLVSLVLFIRVYLQAGRRWLAWVAIASRTLVVILDFAVSPNLNFRSISAIRYIPLFGTQPVATPEGQTSLLSLTGLLSSLLVLIFIVDAMIAVWRRGDRHRAVVVGGSMAIFIALATGHAALVVWGLVQAPFFISIAYVVIVAAMSYELGQDVADAAILSRQLQVNRGALHESEQQMDLAASASGLGMWTWDIGRDEVWMSERGRVLFGINSHEPMNFDRCIQAIHPEDRQQVIHSIANAMNHDGEFKSEFRILLPAGHVRWYAGRGRVEFNGTGKPVLFRGIAIDITDRRRAEDAVRESESRFRQVVEASPNAMLMVDSQARIALVNTQVEVVFGYSRNELIGKSIETLIPDWFRDAPPRYRRDSLAAPPTLAMGAGRDLFGRRKDAIEVPVEIGLSTIEGAEGRFVLASVVDLTARRMAEIESQQQRAELAHLSRVTMLGELSGSLAHELNQPLTAILSNAEAAQQFLSRQPVDLDEVRAILNDIVYDDHRAGEVIRRLRLLFQKGEMQRQEIDVNVTVRDVLKLINSDLLNHGVTVRTNLADALPTLQVDRVQIQQVLLNLIMNGCDAMLSNASGHRELSISTALADGAVVTISVTDCGSGIPLDRLEQVFVPFFTTKAHGMGLGLTVCRTIILAHGGRLWAANNPDEGATFRVALPTEAEVEIS